MKSTSVIGFPEEHSTLGETVTPNETGRFVLITLSIGVTVDG